MTTKNTVSFKEVMTTVATLFVGYGIHSVWGWFGIGMTVSICWLVLMVAAEIRNGGK